MDPRLDPVVVGALVVLREFKNDFSHPMDLRQVGLTFRRLVKSGINYHEDPIRHWLMKDGWTEEWADKVADVATYERWLADEKDLLESVIDQWRKIGLSADNE